MITHTGTDYYHPNTFFKCPKVTGQGGQEPLEEGEIREDHIPEGEYVVKVPKKDYPDELVYSD